MKAYVKKDTLVQLIKDHTILTKESITAHWQWFDCGDGIVPWDFVIKDKVLIDIELVDSIEKHKQQTYEKTKIKSIEDAKKIQRLTDELFEYKKMNFWQRVKFVFKG